MNSKVINKSVLSKQLSAHMGWSQTDSLAFIDACFDFIKIMLKAGNRIIVSGFGVFQLNLRKKRRLLHPITQLPIMLPERICPQFTPSRIFTSKLNLGHYHGT